MHQSHGILNAALSSAIVGLGHGQTIFIVDPGFPIPKGPLLIDLALRAGIPSFFEVLTAVVEELVVETVIVADELVANESFMNQIADTLSPGVVRERVSHVELKRLAADAQVIIRTGELTAYSNVALVGGVAFPV